MAGKCILKCVRDWDIISSAEVNNGIEYLIISKTCVPLAQLNRLEYKIFLAVMDRPVIAQFVKKDA